MSKPLKKSLKELARLLVLAVIPVLVVYFGDLPYEWAGVAIALLRFVDKYLHSSGIAKLGLTRF